MNKWKIGFWICLTLLIAVTLFGFYTIIDQGVTLTYLREGYEDTEHDLDALVDIINNTDLSKVQVQEKLKTHPFYEFMEFSLDTVHMDRVTIIFENNKLVRIEKQW